MIRVLIIDDDPLVAEALSTILRSDQELRVAALAHSGEAATALYSQHKPDIVVMDIRMSGLDGISAGQRLLARWPEARILFLTTFSDDEYIIQALKMGAKGYVLKQNYESLIPAIKAICLGQRVFGEAIVEKLPRLIQQGTGASAANFGLNEREFAVMRLVADGLSNREIGEAVFLGEGTVRNYVSAILEKLKLRDRTQLAVFYHRHF